MDSGFMSTDEASHYLGIKTSTLYSMVEGKEIPHYRIGRLIKFTKTELDSWVQQRRVDSIDIEKGAKKILNHAHNTNIDMDALVKRSVAKSKRSRYTSAQRKADRIRGLGKEVSHGAL